MTFRRERGQRAVRAVISRRDIGSVSRVWRDVGFTTIRDNLSSIDNAGIILATHTLCRASFRET